MRRLAAILVCALAAGCSAAPAPRAGGGTTETIRVAAVDGPALPMARLLTAATVDELAALGLHAEAVDVAGDADGPGYLLQGRAERNVSDPRLPYVVMIHWSLTDKAGRPVGRFAQGVQGSWWQWENGDPRIISAAGRGAANAVAAMLGDGRPGFSDNAAESR